MLESLEDLLESGGYVPRGFSSAAALIDMGFAGLDVLITDIGMPGTDGFELHEMTRKARPDLPVFLITGRHELANQDRIRKARGFFRKPFDAKALLAAVADAVRDSKDGR
jgi:FixJ family two-component response regulator